MTALAAIVNIGNREVISTGQFNTPLVADKILRDGVNDWLSISEIAKFAYGKSFLANNRRTRAYVWQLRRELIRRGHLLITEGRPVEHIKIFVAGSEHELQLAAEMLIKMRKRSDFSADVFAKAEALFEAAATTSRGEELDR